MKKMKRLILMMAMVGLAIYLFTGSASAALYTFTQPELLGMVESFDNPSGIGDVLSITPDGPGALFVGNILDGLPQWRSVGIGYPWGLVPASAKDLSAYEGYVLDFRNTNNQDWWVNLFMNTGWTDAPYSEPNNFYQNGWTKFLVGDYGPLTLDFASEGVINANHVTNIGFQLAFNEPLPGAGGSFQGDQYHMVVNAGAVPEPGTLMLLGSGLLGIAGYARVRFGSKKKEV